MVVISCYKHKKVLAGIVGIFDGNRQNIGELPMCSFCAENENARQRFLVNYRNMKNVKKKEIA